jgi:hypothetical protein
MSVTTFAQSWAKQAAGMKAFDRLYKASGVPGSVSGSDYVDLVQAYNTTAQSDGQEAVSSLGAFSAIRQQLNSALSSSSLQAAFNPQLAVTSRSPQVNSSSPSVSGQLDDVYNYMVINGYTVTSRGLVRSAWSQGSPCVGNGTWLRLWIDQYGWPIEVGFPETMTFLCTGDSNTTAPWKGREKFRLAGQPFTDHLLWNATGFGSGINTSISAQNSDDSLLANASFAASPSGGDTSPNGSTTYYGTSYGNISGWLVVGGLSGSGSDIIVNRTTYFQESQNENGSPASLEFLTSKTIFQPLKGTLSNNIAINPAVPNYAGIRVRADAGPSQWEGTIVLSLGGKNYTLSVTSQTGWILLDNSGDQVGSWYKNWGTGYSGPYPTFQIAVTRGGGAGSGSYLLVDTADYFNWNPITDTNTQGVVEYQVGRGGTTNWIVNDTGTVATTEAQTNTVVIQPWSHRWQGTYWPSRPAAPTTSAPTLAAGSAGVVTNGVHGVAYAYKSTDGILSPISASTNITISGNDQVSVSVLPTSGFPTNVASLELFMTHAGGSTFYDTGVSVALGTSTGVINVADSSLTVAASTITISEP